MSTDPAPNADDVEEDPKPLARPSVGEPVFVEDKDGEQHRAAIAELPAETAGSFMIERRGKTISLVDYWRPIQISIDQRVIGVRYVKGVAPDGTPRTYQKRITHYPANRVIPLSVAEVDEGP